MTVKHSCITPAWTYHCAARGKKKSTAEHWKHAFFFFWSLPHTCSRRKRNTYFWLWQWHHPPRGQSPVPLSGLGLLTHCHTQSYHSHRHTHTHTRQRETTTPAEEKKAVTDAGLTPWLGMALPWQPGSSWPHRSTAASRLFLLLPDATSFPLLSFHLTSIRSLLVSWSPFPSFFATVLPPWAHLLPLWLISSSVVSLSSPPSLSFSLSLSSLGGREGGMSSAAAYRQFLQDLEEKRGRCTFHVCLLLYSRWLLLRQRQTAEKQPVDCFPADTVL